MSARTDDLAARFAAMTPEERAATMDSYYHLDDQEWRLYTCCDCDPTIGDPDDPDDASHGQTVPAMIVLPASIDKPSHCPRCESYLSLDEKGTAVRVTTLGAREGS